MTGQQPFGRRAPQRSPSVAGPATTLSPGIQTLPHDPLALTPEAEAFRASLKETPRPGREFSDWRRDQGGRRILALVLRLALFLPGVAALALQAPWWASLGLEGAAAAAAWWLRQDRRRRLRAIAAWEPEAR